MYPTRFPRNQWYVLARTEELRDRPLARTVLGNRVVLFRDESGAPSALEDRCLHRSMPLSLGTLRNGRLQCRYHGVTYDGAGAVVDIPCQTGVPGGRRARSFPLASGAHLIWMWPGDPARADPVLLPDHAWLDDDRWRTVGGTLHMDARAQLLNENLTDLSHVSYVHAGSIGTAEIARAPITVDVDGRVPAVLQQSHGNLRTHRTGLGRRVRRAVLPRQPRGGTAAGAGRLADPPAPRRALHHSGSRDHSLLPLV